MADRRMFAKSIIDSDVFLDMPLSTQALYFHLSMRADDDGFINNPKRICRTIGCSIDDMKLLATKQFIIPFESGIVVIKHWRIHNYIQADRKKTTEFLDELDQLEVGKNKAYNLKDTPRIQSSKPLDTECIQSGYSLDTQVRLGKESIDKDIHRGGDIYTPSPTPKGDHQTVILTDDEYKSLVSKYGAEVVSEYIRRLDTHLSTGGHKTNHALVIEDWIIKDKPQPQSKPKGFNNFTERESDWDAITDRLKLMDT